MFFLDVNVIFNNEKKQNIFSSSPRFDYRMYCILQKTVISIKKIKKIKHQFAKL